MARKPSRKQANKALLTGLLEHRSARVIANFLACITLDAAVVVSEGVR